jgi:hypothetical protein
MHAFRALLAAGAVLIAALALAGLFPVALITAAIVVPLLVVLYLVEVDLYEDEPWRVMAFTVAWGIAAGIGVGFLSEAVRQDGATLLPQTTSHAVVWNGVLIPLIGFALVMAGPLVLLRSRRFDDVLDGVTFGGACAVVFAGAELLTHSSTFLAAGFEPPGLVTPWVVRLLTLGIAVPVLAAAAVGAATGAVWLRFRAPQRDRDRLGAFGHPLVAVPLAAGMLVGAALLQLYLGRWAALLALVALDVAALAWLRQLIHLGLLEEAATIEVGPPQRCANCGHETPRHTFCRHCGVALRALPKAGEHRPRAWTRTAVRFAVGLTVLVGLAAIVMAAVQPGGVGARCPAGQVCVNPPRSPGTATPTTLQMWRSALGVSLSYDPGAWHVDTRGANRLALIHGDDLALVIDVSPLTSTPERLLASSLDDLRGRYRDLELDADPSHQPSSPALGSVPALGAAFAGHDEDGNPVEALVEAATARDLAVVVTAWTSRQAHTSRIGLGTPFDVLQSADVVLQSLHWPFEPAAGGRA